MIEIRINVTLGGVYSLKGAVRTLLSVRNVIYLEFGNGYVGVYIRKKIIKL